MRKRGDLCGSRWKKGVSGAQNPNYPGRDGAKGLKNSRWNKATGKHSSKKSAQEGAPGGEKRIMGYIPKRG